MYEAAEIASSAASIYAVSLYSLVTQNLKT